MRIIVEADGIKPCPICGKTKGLRITERESFNETYVERGYPLIHLECGDCNLELWSHKCKERTYDKHLAWLARRWNKLWDRKEVEE